MITEDYCSYEVAKLLKEKGFDIPCKYAWHSGIKEPDFHRHSRNFNGGDYKDLRTKWYSAPTHQMAMKWLREEQGIVITVDYDEDEDCEDNERYGFTIYRKNERKVDLATFPTYEEAVEAALKYCLTYMI